MDEPSATRVSAPPAEVVERSDRRTQRLQISLRLETTNSANFVCGFLLQQLNRAGFLVDAIYINRSETPLASYTRPRG